MNNLCKHTDLLGWLSQFPSPKWVLQSPVNVTGNALDLGAPEEKGIVKHYRIACLRRVCTDSSSCEQMLLSCHSYFANWNSRPGRLINWAKSEEFICGQKQMHKLFSLCHLGLAVGWRKRYLLAYLCWESFWSVDGIVRHSSWPWKRRTTCPPSRKPEKWSPWTNGKFK